MNKGTTRSVVLVLVVVIVVVVNRFLTDIMVFNIISLIFSNIVFILFVMFPPPGEFPPKVLGNPPLTKLLASE